MTDFMISVRGKTYAIFIGGEEGSNDEGKCLPSLQENSIEYFKNSCTIIRIANDEDIKNISLILDKKR